MPVALPTPKRGAIPSPRAHLVAAPRFTPVLGAPLNTITIPQQISMWGNDVNGDCVTAEEAFAKACNSPEIFVPDSEVISWATKHGVLNGAVISQVLQWMQNDGFQLNGGFDDDGPASTVNWSNASVLQSAIATGPVKLGIAADQIENAWRSTNGQSGWFATGFRADNNEDHCVSLCGYGTIAWLAQQLHVQVPPGIDGTRSAYAMFTWDTIGIIDAPSMDRHHPRGLDQASHHHRSRWVYRQGHPRRYQPSESCARISQQRPLHRLERRRQRQSQCHGIAGRAALLGQIHGARNQPRGPRPLRPQWHALHRLERRRQ